MRNLINFSEQYVDFVFSLTSCHFLALRREKTPSRLSKIYVTSGLVF